MKIATLAAGAGRIGIAACPGSRFSRDVELDGTGTLGRDLAHLRDWGARLVVSALELAELDEMGVAGLAALLEAEGIEWHHVPIRDFGIPDVRAEGRWFWAETRIQRVLAEGGGVLLHCAVGIGRSATLGARLLCDLGATPAEAIAAVRRVRPGAVENRAQQEHVAAYAGRASLPPGGASPPTRTERLLGCLLGGAVGDGFGYAIEFEPLSSVRKRLGTSGMVSPELDPQGLLVVSDDTQMTLFTLEGLLRSAGPPGPTSDDPVVTAIWQAYRRWFDTQDGGPLTGHEARGWLIDEPALRRRQAPGHTCLSALATGRMGSAAEPLNDSKGCGTVMRTAPIGLWPGCADAGHAYALGLAASAITHGHPTGFHAGGAMAALIHLASRGAAIADAARAARALAARAPDAGEVVAALDAALDAAGRGLTTPAGGLGQGWIAEEALAIGVWAALVGRDFAHSMALAANHDGDSDSTASIAGQIRGAAEGIQSVPAAWARRLDVLDPLLRLAQELAARGAPAA